VVVVFFFFFFRKTSAAHAVAARARRAGQRDPGAATSADARRHRPDRVERRQSGNHTVHWMRPRRLGPTTQQHAAGRRRETPGRLPKPRVAETCSECASIADDDPRFVRPGCGVRTVPLPGVIVNAPRELVAGSPCRRRPRTGGDPAIPRPRRFERDRARRRSRAVRSASPAGRSES